MSAIRRGLCALLLGAVPAAHADFSWELAGLAGRSESDDGPEADFASFESDAALLSATYYFDAVADGDGPLALAAFLDPTTNLFIVASDDEGTTDLGFGATLTETEDAYTIGGTYVFARSKWYAGGRYTSVELQEPSLLYVVTDHDKDRYGVVAGRYFGRGATRLELSLEQSKQETHEATGVTGDVLVPCPFGPCFLNHNVQSETTADTAGLDVMHVGRFRSMSYALSGGIASTDTAFNIIFTFLPPAQQPIAVGAVDADLESDAYSIGAELYPIPTAGFRAGFARVKGSTFPEEEEDTVSVGASWFFRHHVGVELTLSRVDAEFLPRTERADLRVTGRLR